MAPALDLTKASSLPITLNFVRPEHYDMPIALLNTHDAFMVALTINEWLIKSVDADLSSDVDPFLLRRDDQRLHAMAPNAPGQLIIFAGAATLACNDMVSVSIMALTVAGSDLVRWFYTIATISPLIDQLALNGHCLNSAAQALRPGTQRHHRVYVCLRGLFERALAVPEHPDFLAANRILDFCTDILEPETAMQRLEANEVLLESSRSPNYLELYKDRYVHAVEPVERIIAAEATLHCAAYLKIKREFFREFFTDIQRDHEKIRKGKIKPKTEKVHIQHLERKYGWKTLRARKVIVSWEILGFLDEKRYLSMVDENL